MDGFSHSDIKALQSLLSVENEDSDSDGDLDQKGKYKLGPGHIGPPKDSKTMGISPHESLKPVGHDIWHQSEITTSQITEVLDSRAQPEYEIKFKQAVTTEDVFLGMGFKTPASTSYIDSTCQPLTQWIQIPLQQNGTRIYQLSS
ncbi:protein PIH1D3 isoform X3 [Fopius arisanus]|uniref:Protein PIH1D3 isoform X3 n=1 Tax=Fopius arisanus TaxID=64838 RepID=A0A9R1T4C4_9HYME|nr:PREDICTED: protein PIH1D3 isoform X3 [Fopius arisanus]